VKLIYAGFWRRVLASIIDGIIFTPVVFVLAAVIAMVVPAANHAGEAGEAMVGLLIAGYMMMIGVALVGGWLYYTLMESSRHRATLGKMVAGIQVTDLNGSQISFARANGRYFAKYISGMILYLGFVMAGFTEKKQALHDIIAGSLVIRKTQ
jgi:uncharacterized RDD family membrane protein YckC